MISSLIEITELQHIKIEYINQEYVATLIDINGFEIIKGYGSSNINAINDLHKGLI
ncbi:hypothetical protein [Tenacibaculum singaporense]|uniref:hypothetical protein n=1 Tax=Tenacibaculum singaporense TaxID=2358479 RepID=UPI00142E627C|nr:hypothetical protein [Tenacibaculum singaporense]